MKENINRNFIMFDGKMKKNVLLFILLYFSVSFCDAQNIYIQKFSNHVKQLQHESRMDYILILDTSNIICNDLSFLHAEKFICFDTISRKPKLNKNYYELAIEKIKLTDDGFSCNYHLSSHKKNRPKRFVDGFDGIYSYSIDKTGKEEYKTILSY